MIIILTRKTISYFLKIAVLTVMVFCAGLANAATINITGTLYSDEGITEVTSGKTITLAVGTSSASVQSTSTDSGTGDFTFYVDNANGLSVDTPIIVYLDGDASKAVTVTKASSVNSFSGLDLHQGRVIVKQEGSTSTSLSDLSFYDYTDDSDIQYIASSTLDSLDVLSGQELHIWNGDTFVAAASTTLSGSFHNEGVFDNNEGTIIFSATGSTTSQYISGNLTGLSNLGNIIASGTSNKRFLNSASTTDLTIQDVNDIEAYLAANWDPNDTNVINGPSSVKVRGNYAYTTSYFSSNLAIVDVSSSTNPTLAYNWDPNNTSVFNGGQTVHVAGDYAYIGGFESDNMIILDISSSTNPTVAGNWDPDDANVMDSVIYIDVVGDYAYVAGYSSNNLAIVDISSSTNPVTVGNWDPNDNNVMQIARSVKVVGDYAYVSGSNSSNLAIVDISSSTNPTLAYNWDPNNSEVMSIARSIDVVGNYAYIPGYNSDNMIILDVSSSTNPTVEGNWDPNDANVMNGASAVKVVGNYAYVIGQLSNNIAIVDISSSTNPTLAYNWDPNDSNIVGGAYDIDVENGLAYVAGTDSDNIALVNLGVGTVVAPTTTLSIAGDYTNNNPSGFSANYGTTTFSGTSLQTATGTMITEGGAFNNLHLTNVSGDGNSTQSVTFGSLITVSGLFDMEPDTSVAFLAGATSTFNRVDLNGENINSPIYLRSNVDDEQWYVDILSEPIDIRFVNVKDSNASSSTNGGVYASSSINSGNNSNWFFDLAAGESVLDDHDATQVNNAFDFQNKTNEALFVFKLTSTPGDGDTNISNLVINITGAKNIDTADFSNIRLYRDNDGDADYDASDELLGTGIMSISGQSGDITFADDFLATTSFNYVVVADWNAPVIGSFLTLDLLPSGVTASDDVGVQTVSGSVNHIQHNRNNKGAGGSGASAGGSAPTGRETVGGGGSEGGEVIGDDPNYFWPSANSGAWTNAGNIYDKVDGTYGTDNAGAASSFTNHGFSINSSNVINGIEVKLEISGTTAAGNIELELSWDGGSSWTSSKNTPTLTTTDAVVYVGGAGDTWGRSWSVSEFSNANFAVRLTGNPSGNTVRVDAMQVRVYHQAGGGGSGGGGAI